MSAAGCQLEEPGQVAAAAAEQAGNLPTQKVDLQEAAAAAPVVVAAAVGILPAADEAGTLPSRQV